MSTQIQNSFDEKTIKKIAKGALIAGGGAVIAYLLKIIPTIDFGNWTPAVVALSSILINIYYQYKRGEIKIGS